MHIASNGYNHDNPNIFCCSGRLMSCINSYGGISEFVITIITDMKHVLCPEDGDDLYTFIKSATQHWKDIARALMMTHVQTKDIISTPGLTQQSDYFQEMLHRWLKWAPPVHPLPTTEDLADALRAVGAEGVAYKLVKCSQFTSDLRLI